MNELQQQQQQQHVVTLELISDTMWPNGYIGKCNIKKAVELFENQNINKNIRFAIHRVPFFLEPGYMKKPDDFTESHDTRMIRKFGSKEEFERVKARHGLIPRGNEAGLNADNGFTQDNLTKRTQSSTLKSHRLILFVANRFGLVKSEELYAIFNKKHFTEGGILNDRNLLINSLKEIGLVNEDLNESIAFLDDKNRGTKEVLMLYDRVQKLGIYSIPTLIVDGSYLINGAARANEVFECLKKVSESGPTGKSIFNDIKIV